MYNINNTNNNHINNNNNNNIIKANINENKQLSVKAYLMNKHNEQQQLKVSKNKYID